MQTFAKVGKTLDIILNKIDNVKEKIDPALDKTLLVIGANTGAIYTVAEYIDNHNFSEPTNGLIMMASGALIGLGDYAIFGSDKTKPARTKVKAWNNQINKNRTISWVKTLGLTGAIFFAGRELKPYGQQIYEDISGKNKIEISNSSSTSDITDIINIEEATKLARENSDIKLVKIKNLSARPKIYDDLSYTSKINYDFSGTQLASKNSTIGRIQRTLRWEPIFRAVEQKYGMPAYTLAGMIMQESYGDPVQPNSSGDGGLGVVHIQGTTGKAYGLKIHGTSNKDSDKNHGKQIKSLLAELNFDPSKIQAYDERAHIIKVLDAAARIVTEGKKKHGSWTYGVEYYRNPNKVGKNTTWQYQHMVNYFKNTIQDKKLLEQAKQDFEKRNNCTFQEYIRKHQEMNQNWGLQKYKSSKF